MSTSKEYPFDLGVVVGKFYPFHAGHKYLIETASSQCAKLVIIIPYHQDDDIPGLLRTSWIKATFPEEKYIIIPVDQDAENLPDTSSQAWAEYTVKLLGRAPDVVFTSELYGNEWSRLMGSQRILVDLERKIIPISGTLIRSNPLEYLQYLDPIVRGFFVKRICILGGESTGKTTLSKALSRALNTIYVPEYGHNYMTFRKEDNDIWRSEEFNIIAHTQAWMEDYLATMANKVIIVDTDAYVTSVFHYEYMGTENKELEEFASSRPIYDLYIVPDIATPFHQDHLDSRSEERRIRMHNTYLKHIESIGGRVLHVSGTTEERVEASITLIAQILKEPKVVSREIFTESYLANQVLSLNIVEGI